MSDNYHHISKFTQTHIQKRPRLTEVSSGIGSSLWWWYQKSNEISLNHWSCCSEDERVASAYIRMSCVHMYITIIISCRDPCLPKPAYTKPLPNSMYTAIYLDQHQHSNSNELNIFHWLILLIGDRGSEEEQEQDYRNRLWITWCFTAHLFVCPKSTWNYFYPSTDRPTWDLRYSDANCYLFRFLQHFLLLFRSNYVIWRFYSYIVTSPSSFYCVLHHFANPSHFTSCRNSTS